MPAKEHLSNLFVQTLEQAMDGVVVIDSRNNIILYNKAAENLWGFSHDEVMGKNVKILVPDNIKPNHDKYVNANRETGVNKIVGMSRDIEIVRKDGSIKWGSFSISKVEVDGKILYTAFVKDVTEMVVQRKRIEMLSLVTDKTDNAIFITDSQWNVVYINKGFSNILGYQEADILGRSPISVISPVAYGNKVAAIRASLQKGEAVKLEAPALTKDGREVWCSVMANPVFNDAGELTNIVTVMSEITATKLHEVLHANILGAIAKDKPLEVIMEVACREISRVDNSIIPAILRVDEEQRLQLLAAPALPLDYRKTLSGIRIGEGAASSGTAAYRQQAVLAADIASDPLWADYKDRILPLGIKSCWSSPIKSKGGEAIGVIAFYRKEHQEPSEIDQLLISVLSPLCGLAIEREKQRQDIRHLAYYDSLTKLPNRSLLHAEAEHALRAVEAAQQTLAVLFLDMDRFKQINDSAGHPAGDLFLQKVAARISQKCADSDIAGRLSGDEFVVITKYKTQAKLNNYIEELKQCIAEPVQLPGLKVSPSVSIGVSTYPDDGRDIGTLIHRADMAMYQAKTSGKGRFAFFSHELNQLAQERQELEIELQKAIENGDLELAYQPQINMKDGSLYGVEALARWYHPKFGSVSPGKFIPLAEECGLIGDLSNWALRSACQQMAIWRNKGVAILSISVNLSPINFHNMDLCNVIMSELDSHNLKASDITLELTEGVFLDTNPNTMKVLHDIHQQGVGFSIDDFGTGYSGLSYLRRIPIKELKLDKSFVNELEQSATGRALSKAVLQIGESLNLDVVAEGIEHQGQYKILKNQGYHVAQGFLFSKPLNSVEIEAWMHNIPVNKPQESESLISDLES
ncbi:EAL domain-containing protein [Marinomonas pollencensis]|uniref:Diguanylate cyclase/phosphodiesterase with PAS/PAC sensor(S) n=1 Tax=Marinomonas pollencensis TaxID=491954 RepID=A0A3E0D8X0_9GAMM|nr:EAL domain-containing protein [Marinomonas pollencensis]REG78462.1 diguanylate cyclase/phosphodiesterase with PAS/PAC sensor(s) [Marinomonas pollencensis]